MKKIIMILSCMIGFLSVICIGGIYVYQEKTKAGWIDLNKVYADFEFKKELENKLIKTQQARQTIIDTLELELKLLSRQLKTDNQKDKGKRDLFEVKKEEYYKKKKTFEEDNDALQKQYNDQILVQLNQYLRDYGDKHGYTYIYGADGTGVLMYADKSKEITNEVKKYINERYKGDTK